MKVRLVAVLLLALLAPGCYDLEEEVVIRSDGSGTLVVSTTVSEEILVLLEDGVPLLEQLRERVVGAAADENVLGVEVEELLGDDVRTFETRAEIADLTELTGETMQILFGGGPASQGPPLTDFSVEAHLEGFQFTQRLRASVPSNPALAAAHDEGEIVVRLRGGRVFSHNGELTPNGAIEWRFELSDLYSGNLAEVELTAVLGGVSGKNELRWRIIGALGLVVVGGLLWWAGRVREA